MSYNTSEWKVWDFFNNPNILSELSPGVIAINCFDAYVEKMIISKLPYHSFNENKIHPMVGPDVTEEIISEKMLIQDFFSENNSYYILLSDELKIDVLRYIINQNNEFDQKYLFLFFRSNSLNWKEVLKENDIQHLKLSVPTFWEGSKLFNFVTGYFKLSLPYEISNYLIEALPLEIGEYIKYLKLIKLNFANTSTVQLWQIKEFIEAEKVDNFLFGKLYGQKDFKSFYKLLIEKKISDENLRSLIVFLQSHLMKLIDVSYTEKKKRISNYDKEILVHSKLWKKSELYDHINILISYELKLKQKNSMLNMEFKREYLSLQ